MSKTPHEPKLASAKQKKENKDLQQENATLRLKLDTIIPLFIKHNLLPQLAVVPCECEEGRMCIGCAARSILMDAGHKLPPIKKESPLILPGDIG